MSSLKQIEANRRNAEKSTGPSTPEGKLRSRGNAVRHGLTAETVIPSLEDADDYEAFELAITSDYDAATAVERELVLRLASVLWRLRRATGIETALFEAFSSAESHKAEDQALPPFIRRLFKDARPNRSAPTSQKNLLAGFMRATELTCDTFERLNRYEYLLWRQARQLICTLEWLRYRQSKARRLRYFTGHQSPAGLPENISELRSRDIE